MKNLIWVLICFSSTFLAGSVPIQYDNAPNSSTGLATMSDMVGTETQIPIETSFQIKSSSKTAGNDVSGVKFGLKAGQGQSEELKETSETSLDGLKDNYGGHYKRVQPFFNKNKAHVTSGYTTDAYIKELENKGNVNSHTENHTFDPWGTTKNSISRHKPKLTIHNSELPPLGSCESVVHDDLMCTKSLMVFNRKKFREKLRRNKPNQGSVREESVVWNMASTVPGCGEATPNNGDEGHCDKNEENAQEDYSQSQTGTDGVSSLDKESESGTSTESLEMNGNNEPSPEDGTQRRSWKLKIVPRSRTFKHPSFKDVLKVETTTFGASCPLAILKKGMNSTPGSFSQYTIPSVVAENGSSEHTFIAPQEYTKKPVKQFTKVKGEQQIANITSANDLSKSPVQFMSSPDNSDATFRKGSAHSAGNTTESSSSPSPVNNTTNGTFVAEFSTKIPQSVFKEGNPQPPGDSSSNSSSAQDIANGSTMYNVTESTNSRAIQYGESPDAFFKKGKNVSSENSTASTNSSSVPATRNATTGDSTTPSVKIQQNQVETPKEEEGPQPLFKKDKTQPPNSAANSTNTNSTQTAANTTESATLSSALQPGIVEQKYGTKPFFEEGKRPDPDTLADSTNLATTMKAFSSAGEAAFNPNAKETLMEQGTEAACIYFTFPTCKKIRLPSIPDILAHGLPKSDLLPITTPMGSNPAYSPSGNTSQFHSITNILKQTVQEGSNTNEKGYKLKILFEQNI